MGSSWRLIRDGSHDAAMNMAVDEAIMLTHAEGRCPPTVRLYGWERPSVSLGYFQDLSRGGLDVDYCCCQGVPLVRRLTGGRAVLHGHDVTFSIVIAESELPPDNRSVLGSHTWLMGGIVQGLRLIGLDARLGGRENPSTSRSADCFAHAAACDVVAGGCKVAGSAQVRRNGVILEQGSIPFRRPEIEPSAVFGRQEMGPDQLDGVDRDALENAVIRGFAESLGIELAVDELSPAEVETALKLAGTRFGDQEWTLRRTCAFVDIGK